MWIHGVLTIKNVFTASRVVYISGGSGQKTKKWLV